MLRFSNEFDPKFPKVLEKLYTKVAWMGECKYVGDEDRYIVQFHHEGVFHKKVLYSGMISNNSIDKAVDLILNGSPDEFIECSYNGAPEELQPSVIPAYSYVEDKLEMCIQKLTGRGYFGAYAKNIENNTYAFRVIRKGDVDGNIFNLSKEYVKDTSVEDILSGLIGDSILMPDNVPKNGLGKRRLDI